MLAREEWSLPKVQPVDVFSLESLIAWLEKMPGDEIYEYGCNGGCLLARYFEAMGFRDVQVGAEDWYYDKFSHHSPLPPDFNDIALAASSRFGLRSSSAYTFGAALARARSTLDCKLSSPDGTKAA